MPTVKTFADIDIVKAAQDWAAPFADPTSALDPLIAIDVDTITGRKEALEKVAVLLFQQLVASVVVREELTLEHPLVAGVAALYAHKDFGIDLRKRIGARTYTLKDDATVDVGAAVQALADGGTESYRARAVLHAFAEHLLVRAKTMAYADGRPFLDQYTADGTGAQRALCVAAVLDARQLLK